MHHGKGKMCGVHMVAWWLLVIGGLNWGLVGAANFNLVARIFGSVNWLERLIYVLVGLAALAMLFKGSCKQCSDRCCMEEKMEKKEGGMGGGAGMQSGGMSGGAGGAPMGH